jgi:hypothetical protein
MTAVVDMATLLPPLWLIRAAVAAVWLYEGLWCKLLRGQPHELEGHMPFLRF